MSDHHRLDGPFRDEPSASIRESAAWRSLEGQRAWYSEKSAWCKTWYKVLRTLQLALAVLIPLVVHLPYPYSKWPAAVAGALIAFLEGIQQVNQFSERWIAFRTTSERLNREKRLFLAQAGQYQLPEPARLRYLAESVDEVLATEHAEWNKKTRQSIFNQGDQNRDDPNSD